jgi:hypothetical protein
MKVLTRDEAGMWVRWSVKRRVLSWKVSPPTWGSGGGDGVIALVLLAYNAIVLLAFGIFLLLSAAVMRPIRARSGRWPVVAVRLGTGDDDRFTLAWVNGRPEADALVVKWAAEIKEHGRPLP